MKVWCVRMQLAAIVLNLAFLGAPALAADTCGQKESAIEIGDCLALQVANSEKVLERYLKASQAQLQSNPKALLALNKAQQAWKIYKRTDCEAVYELWSGGSIKNALFQECTIQHLRRRTHDLWKSYLTFMDSTPPLLPEPERED